VIASIIPRRIILFKTDRLVSFSFSVLRTLLARSVLVMTWKTISQIADKLISRFL